MRLIYLTISALILAFNCYAQPVPSTMEEKMQRTRELVEQGSHPTNQEKIDSFDAKSSAISVLQSLVLLVGIVFVGAWGYKKYVLKDKVVTNRTLKITERIPIAPKANLLLAEIDGRKVLVGLTSDSIALLELGKAAKDFAVELEKEIAK